MVVLKRALENSEKKRTFSHFLLFRTKVGGAIFLDRDAELPIFLDFYTFTNVTYQRKFDIPSQMLQNLKAVRLLFFAKKNRLTLFHYG